MGFITKLGVVVLLLAFAFLGFFQGAIINIFNVTETPVYLLLFIVGVLLLVIGVSFGPHRIK